MSIWDGDRRRIHLQDVGPRDGLQMEDRWVPTEQKIALVDALSRTGLAKIEVTAFVSPKAIPALRDAWEVMRGIERVAGVTYAVLVPNLRGAERALDAGVDELNLVMSASETHNLANLRMTRGQSLASLARVAALGHAAGVPLNIALSCSFGCPMEGAVPPYVVLHWCERLLALGARGITLADTTGMADPLQVHTLVRAFRGRWPAVELTLHFHDTRGLAIANVLAAIDAGADRFDASLGGLGGCPYAPGASGNACTEDLAHALALMNYDTGVDLDALLAASRRLPGMIGHDTPSALAKAGPSLTRHPVPEWLAEVAARAAERDSRT